MCPLKFRQLGHLFLTSDSAQFRLELLVAADLVTEDVLEGAGVVGRFLFLEASEDAGAVQASKVDGEADRFLFVIFSSELLASDLVS